MQEPPVTTSPQRPTLIYDADCGFCTRSALWLARGGRGRFAVTAWQSVTDLEALGLNLDKVTTAAWWVVEGRAVAGGAPAIARALVARGWPWAVAGHVIGWPVVRGLARRVYAVVARNRHRMPGGTGACKLPNAG